MTVHNFYTCIQFYVQFDYLLLVLLMCSFDAAFCILFEKYFIQCLVAFFLSLIHSFSRTPYSPKYFQLLVSLSTPIFLDLHCDLLCEREDVVSALAG